MAPRARLTVLLTAATACVVALSAATAGNASSSISLARYDKRADAVCLAYDRKAARLPHIHFSDFPGVVRLVRRALPLVTTAIRGLRAIPLPPDKRSLVKSWLRRHYRIPRLLKALEAAAKKKSRPAVRAANLALQENGAAERSLARRLGMRICSQT
jgi:hypothetical protein